MTDTIDPHERSTENMEYRIAEPALWVLDYLSRTMTAIHNGDWLEVDNSAQDIARRATELAEAARETAAERRPRAEAVVQKIDQRPAEANLFRYAAGLPVQPFHPAIVDDGDGSVTLAKTGERILRPQPSQSELDTLSQLTAAVPKLRSPKPPVGGAGQPHQFRGDLPAFEPGRCGLPGCGQLSSALIHQAKQ